jgi:hypothetical protein
VSEANPSQVTNLKDTQDDIGRRLNAHAEERDAAREAAKAFAAKMYAKACAQYGVDFARAAFAAMAKRPPNRPASDEKRRDDALDLHLHEDNLRRGMTPAQSAAAIGTGKSVSATLRRLQRLRRASHTT